MSNQAHFNYQGHVELDAKGNMKRKIGDFKVKNVTILTPIKIDVETDGKLETIYGKMDFPGQKIYVDSEIDVEQLRKAVFEHMNVRMDEATFAAPPEYMDMAEQMRKESDNQKENNIYEQ